MIAQAQMLFATTVSELEALIRRMNSGEWDGKGASVASELRKALALFLEENNRIARLSKEQSGVAYDYALDFDAARIEIGRRLACLRDAGGG
ncbi:hypothetical protein [Defluviimonas sp. WL0075]|uniref:Uncharacterized protein n=1 Tax=Albidovulum sediminicola TaxID=2984331 RepID=A0ABT2Z0T2_9RHOB|nr:hypothetical protein [Defluviimonas sp. WL0075]MCV2864622.1 hypothetical protein [Defluviimonas sp. WL0075]